MKGIFYRKNKYDDVVVNWGAVIVAFTAFALVLSIVLAASIPLYNVWSKELAGKATLREAEWNRQVTIEEAKGVAEANAIIGESLQGNEAYLRYLWIQGLHDGSSETIYIPTEANLPLLEASRLLKG